MAKMMYGFPLGYLSHMRVQLARESHRGRLLLAGIYIEELLTARFMNERLKPSTLSKMLKEANRAHWIDDDVFHDAEIIRTLRNRCAHEGSEIVMNAEDIRATFQRFRVPHRRYYDWGKIRVATTRTGFAIYRDDRPPDAVEDIHLPGVVTFHLAIGLILLVLAANLEVPFATEEPGTAAILELPAFMHPSASDLR